MKKIFIAILFAFLFLPSFVLAKNEVNVYFFNGDGCPHCAKEEKFLHELENKYPEINVNSYEVWYNRDNAKLMGEIGKKLDLKIQGVPLTIVGDKVIPGFYTAETTGQDIEQAVKEAIEKGCTDIVAPIINKEVQEENQTCEHGCEADDEECQHDCGCSNDTTQLNQEGRKINVPFLGQINSKDLSLPALTILIAAIDGFNPCAMWVLIFLITLLLGMENRAKMWVLGGSFILSSGIAYFLFLSAWLNLFLFIGFVFWIRLLIAVVALGSGSYHVIEYLKNPKGLCHVTDGEKRKKIFTKLKGIISEKNFWLALAGIILLAVAVNMVELVCSAGLPTVYTQILALADLPAWQYYLYLVLYIVIFMLDDLLVFIIAMATLQLKGVSSKYTHYANLIGGIIMVIIGLLLLFKPGWLMFG